MNKILLSPGAGDEGGGTPPPQQMSQDQMQKEIAALRQKNAALEAENTELSKTAEIMPGIKARMEAGLTREQAESVEKQQIEHDKALAKIEEDQEKAREKRGRK